LPSFFFDFIWPDYRGLLISYLHRPESFLSGCCPLLLILLRKFLLFKQKSCPVKGYPGVSWDKYFDKLFNQIFQVARIAKILALPLQAETFFEKPL
jgi:hypothetical protein